MPFIISFILFPSFIALFRHFLVLDHHNVVPPLLLWESCSDIIYLFRLLVLVNIFAQRKVTICFQMMVCLILFEESKLRTKQIYFITLKNSWCTAGMELGSLLEAIL